MTMPRYHHPSDTPSKPTRSQPTRSRARKPGRDLRRELVHEEQTQDLFNILLIASGLADDLEWLVIAQKLNRLAGEVGDRAPAILRRWRQMAELHRLQGERDVPSGEAA